MVDKVFGTKASRRKSRREDENKSHDECMHRVLRLEGRISTMAQLLKEDVLNRMMERLTYMTPKIEAFERVLEKFASVAEECSDDEVAAESFDDEVAADRFDDEVAAERFDDEDVAAECFDDEDVAVESFDDTVAAVSFDDKDVAIKNFDDKEVAADFEDNVGAERFDDEVAAGSFDDEDVDVECGQVLPDKVEASSFLIDISTMLKELSQSTAQLALDTKALNKEVSLSTAQMVRDTKAWKACPIIRMDKDDSDEFTEGSNYVVDRAYDCEEWWGRSSNSWQDPPQNDVRIELEESQHADRVTAELNLLKRRSG